MITFRFITTVAATAACLLSSDALAQTGGARATLDVETVRAWLINGFEQHRAMDVEFIRAIPDSALRWAPTPGVRDFAEQIEHIVLDNVMFVARGVVGERAPAFGDEEIYLNDKAELERMVNATYDWVIGKLRGLSGQQLLAEQELFGQRRTGWGIFVFALIHADWTRGQLVPYYRLNGVDLPEWRSF